MQRCQPFSVISAGFKLNFVSLLQVMLARRIQPTHEHYLAILNDRSLNGPAIVASSRGGMNIEDVARDEPEAIITHPINFEKGLSAQE